MTDSANDQAKGTYLARILSNDGKISVGIYDPFTMSLVTTKFCTQLSNECSFAGGASTVGTIHIQEDSGKFVYNNNTFSGSENYALSQNGNSASIALAYNLTKIDTSKITHPVTAPYIPPYTPAAATSTYTPVPLNTAPSDSSICQGWGNCTYSDYPCAQGTCYQTCADSTDGRCVTHVK